MNKSRLILDSIDIDTKSGNYSKNWVTGQIKTHRPKLYTSNLI